MATFGNTSTSGASVLGSLYDSGSDSFNVRGKFTLSEAGTVSKITVYIDNQGAGHRACNIRCGIYDDDGSGGYAGTLMGSATLAVSDNKAAGWVDVTLSSGISLTAGDWWLATQGDRDAGGCNLWGTTPGGVTHASVDAWADGMANPASSPFFTDDVWKLCVYATYTPASSGVVIPVLMHHYRQYEMA